ncbi:hypothetical protein SO694_00004722 [Aureococcus anophagefferens]|uniref:Phosphomevalonate dehydratase large subunit-like domain-containing protein n=1 Tax=Aureococcus anophagefferens TaxID=44056 RepID=A0ABR1G9U2_AURAN
MEADFVAEQNASDASDASAAAPATAEVLVAGADGEPVAGEVLYSDRAESLVSVERAHIDACTYIGPGGLRFAERLHEMGGRFCVPTTTNACSVDRGRWRELGVPDALGVPADALADCYVALGAAPSFTCAPYLRDDAPARGEHLGYSESNAVARDARARRRGLVAALDPASDLGGFFARLGYVVGAKARRAGARGCRSGTLAGGLLGRLEGVLRGLWHDGGGALFHCRGQTPCEGLQGDLDGASGPSP